MTENLPIISVIIPIYNTSMYLDKCINSVIHQTYQNLQIILVNDGSTDNSLSICYDYSEKDSRILVLSKKNGGLSSARNYGIEHTSGEYFCFVDSDDTIDTNFVKYLLGTCINNNVQIAMCGRYNVFPNGKIEEVFSLKSEERWEKYQAIQRLLTWDNIDGSVCDKIFHKELFNGIRFAENRIAEDLPVTVKILLSVDSIIHIGKPLYHYYQRQDSITSQTYSEKKNTVLDSAKEVRTMVLAYFPSLYHQANFYYYRHLLYLLELLSEFSPSQNNNYKKMKSVLSLEFLRILCNRYLCFKSKIKFILIKYSINKSPSILLLLKAYKFIKTSNRHNTK